MKRRVDLYGECNVDGSPVDVFTECCMHCINPECTRSSFGKSKFDIRVNTWYERLFAEVPRMDRGDPRFAPIAAQKFLAINPPLTVNSGWVDPRDLEQPETSRIEPESTPTAPTIEVPTVVETMESVPAAEPTAPPMVETTPQPASPVRTSPVRTAPAVPPSNLALTNTPAQRGQMIPKGNQAPAPVPASSWDSPAPSTDTQGIRVVKPGDKVRIG